MVVYMYQRVMLIAMYSETINIFMLVLYEYHR